MGGNSNGSATTSCGLFEVLLFVAAIITGTMCSICSKTMMSLHAEGMEGNVEAFSKPLFQTIGMFVGMCFGLVMHGLVLFFKIPFPGYDHPKHTTNQNDNKQSKLQSIDNQGRSYGAVETTEMEKLLVTSNSATTKNEYTTPLWLYFFLAIPAIFDVGATLLCMCGLQYIDVSVYQLLRGSGIIFVALMKQHVLKDKLYTFQWIGVAFNVVSVFLVGSTGTL